MTVLKGCGDSAGLLEHEKCLPQCLGGGESWRMLKDDGGCWSMLGDAGGCWSMLEDVGGCWGMLEDAGGCWRMLATRSLHFLLLMDMLSASNCYCWLSVFCILGTSWDPSHMQDSEQLRQWGAIVYLPLYRLGWGSSGWRLTWMVDSEESFWMTAPSLPFHRSMQCASWWLLTMDEGGWKPAKKMVSLKAWWKMITFHSPKSFLLNYQFPLPKAGPGSIGFRKGLFLMEGQFYPGICSFESVPTVWFAVMNLLINELLYSISNKLSNIGMRGNSKIDLTSI